MRTGDERMVSEVKEAEVGESRLTLPLTPLPSWRSEKYSLGRVSKYLPLSTVDGPGFRNVLYLSGCLFKCPGCFNRAAQSFHEGEEYDRGLEDRILRDLEQPWMEGFSLQGGEPFLNTGVGLRVVKAIRRHYGSNRTVWVWSGYTLEQLVETGDEDKMELLSLIDTLVDGPFLQAEQDISLPWRGSRNQKVRPKEDWLHLL